MTKSSFFLQINEFYVISKLCIIRIIENRQISIYSFRNFFYTSDDRMIFLWPIVDVPCTDDKSFFFANITIFNFFFFCKCTFLYLLNEFHNRINTIARKSFALNYIKFRCMGLKNSHTHVIFISRKATSKRTALINS